MYKNEKFLKICEDALTKFPHPPSVLSCTNEKNIEDINIRLEKFTKLSKYG